MSLVLFDVRDNVALLTLNNPDKRNMLTVEVCALISDYVQQAEAHPEVKALIVTGAGEAFCAGMRAQGDFDTAHWLEFGGTSE